MLCLCNTKDDRVQNPAVGAINSAEKDRKIQLCVLITPFFRPNNLLRLESCNLLQIVPAPISNGFFIFIKDTHHPFFSGIAESIIHCHEEIIHVGRKSHTYIVQIS
jgi:hypothetical protein